MKKTFGLFGVIFLSLMFCANAWAIPFFGGASASWTTEEEIQNAAIWAVWEFKLPGHDPIDGGSEAWRKAAKFPYIPGAELYVYFPANTRIGRNLKDGKWTDDQRQRLKDRYDMRYYPGKGWGFRIVFGDDVVKGPGMFTLWGNVQVNDARRTKDRLAGLPVGNRLSDQWTEWPINFGVYRPVKGKLTPRRITDMQAAKGAGSMSLLPPREEEIIVPAYPDEQLQGNTAPAPNNPPQSGPQGEDWVVTIKLSGDGFTESWFRIEAAGGLVDWIHVTGGQSQFDLPREVKSFELWVVQGKNDKSGVKLPGSYNPASAAPVVVTRTARR